MDATDHTTGQTKAQTIGQTLDRISDPLDALEGSRLLAPLRRLREGLGALVVDGSLQGVELEPMQADCPCFLLSVAPGLPRMYVELCLDDEGKDETEDEEAEDGLLVLMNWLGEETDPVVRELGASPSAAELSGVLDCVLLVARSRR